MLKYSRVGRRQTHSVSGSVALLLFLVLLGSLMVLPFVYAVLQSVKPAEELFVFPPRFFVRNPTADNFINLFLRTNNMWVPLGRYITNSVVITVIGTAGSVILSALAAYPIAKFRFPGGKLFETMITMALLFVSDVTAIPRYVVLNALGLLDTQWALIFPAMAGTLGLYLMKQFMTQIPDELIEASMVDGAGIFRQFWSLIMPNTKPAWITALVLTFQALWAQDTSNLVFTESQKNLPALFRQITSTNTIATMGIAAAISIVLLIPPIVVFIVSQSRMIETMAYSGMKG